MPSAAEIIHLLDLKPHPEGGHFRETFRDPRKVDGARATSREHRSSSRLRPTRRGRLSA
jgi:predicted cupin superfamily sugar epimerase